MSRNAGALSVVILLLNQLAISQVSDMAPATISPTLSYPRTIWMYYNQKLNQGLRTVLDITWSTLSPNWTINYLTDTNLSEWIDKHDFPSFFMNLHPVHRSDYLRVYLLYRYGGWYLDFSTLVTSSEYFEMFYNKLIDSRTEFLAFGPPRSQLKEFSTNVLYAPHGSLYATLWFGQVKKLWEIGNLNYVYSIFRSGVTVSHLIFKPYPYATYYSGINFAYLYVQQRLIPRHYPKVVEDIVKNQYALWYDCRQNMTIFKSRFLEELKQPRYPITKLWGIHRAALWNDSGFFPYKPDDVFHTCKVGYSFPRVIIVRVSLWHYYHAIVTLLFVIQIVFFV